MFNLKKLLILLILEAQLLMCNTVMDMKVVSADGHNNEAKTLVKTWKRRFKSELAKQGRAHAHGCEQRDFVRVSVSHLQV